MTLPDWPLPARVLGALVSGNKVEAIKLLREATGLDLKQAKDAVEGPRPANTAATRPATSFTNLPADVVDALQRGRKIEAVRLLRQHTGLGLKDAKDAIDRAGIAASIQAGDLSPGEVPRSTLGNWLAVAAVAAVVAYYFLRQNG
jgi:ribosomal protein L7/L12